jgi:excisionase family DNA binding protein
MHHRIITETVAADIMTVGEVSRELSMSPDRIRQLERVGVLEAARTGTGVRIFSRNVVEEFKRQRKQKRGNR